MVDKPNIILLTIDCLRPDHLSCYGYDKIHTKNIDKIASGGVIFKNAFSNGVETSTAFPALFTSKYSLMGDLKIKNEIDRYWISLSKKYPNLAENLNKMGYRTIGITSNPWISSFFNYNRGFNYFEDFFYKGHPMTQNITQKIRTIRGEKIGRAKILHKIALSKLSNIDLPFFLWIHYMDVHGPYNPKKLSIIERVKSVYLNHKMGSIQGASDIFNDDELRELVELYDKEILYTDYEIGEFLNSLEKIDVNKDNTYFIITADHGEQFGEHGAIGHGTHYDEVIRIPLIIHGVDIEPAVSDQHATIMDIAPTIYDLIGLKTVEKKLGMSLKEHFKNNPLKKRVIISESNKDTYSCRTPKYKYIYNHRNKNKELYDLYSDPFEKNNIIDKNNEMFEVFNLIITKHIDEVEKINRFFFKSIKVLKT